MMSMQRLLWALFAVGMPTFRVNAYHPSALTLRSGARLRTGTSGPRASPSAITGPGSGQRSGVLLRGGPTDDAEFQVMEVKLDATVLFCHVLARGLANDILTRPLKTCQVRDGVHRRKHMHTRPCPHHARALYSRTCVQDSIGKTSKFCYRFCRPDRHALETNKYQRRSLGLIVE